MFHVRQRSAESIGVEPRALRLVALSRRTPSPSEVTLHWGDWCYNIPMPYKSAAAKRKYQREMLSHRRRAWVSDHGPCATCGSCDNLEVDHVDPAEKVTNSVWSWSASRREIELAKCQVLCHACHLAKTSDWRRSFVRHGSDTMYSNFGCRCDECKLARKTAKAATRARRKSLGLPYQ